MNIADYLKTELNSSSLSEKSRIKGKFDQAADYLLRNCKISLNHRIYAVTEIEFYYFSEIHPDPYVHKHPNQLKTGIWYFHDVGQDLTFGSDGGYGGILIRGISSLDISRYIDGPVKTFDEIFNRELRLDDVHSWGMELEGMDFLDKEQRIYDFPRVGMYPKDREHDEEYLLKPYRYLSFPWLTKAERHVIHLYTKYFRTNNGLLGINELLGKLEVDKSMIREYEKAFQKGQQMGRPDIEDILSGKTKMNVINKCRFMGWYHTTVTS